MDNTKALDVIAYYLSEYDLKAVEQLGYESRKGAFDAIAILFGKSGNYLKRLRDEYDVVTNSYRNGQRNRAPRERISSVAAELKKYSFEDLSETVENVIANAKGNASINYEDEIIQKLLVDSVDDNIVDMKRWVEFFDLYVISNQNSDTVSFKDGFISKEEGYKERAFNNAHGALELSTWNEEIIGKGVISGCVIKAISKTENLVNHNQIIHLKNVLANKKLLSEQVLYQLYLGDDDARAFERVVELLGAKYDLVAVLFYIKDKKYLPVRSNEFDKRFDLLEIDFSMAGKCSWDNYSRYLQIVDNIRVELQDHYGFDVDLIDAHTFVWMILGVDEFIKAGAIDKELHEITKVKRFRSLDEVQKRRDEEYPRKHIAELDISVKQWSTLIKTVFTLADVELVKRIYLFDNHAATCSELAAQEGKTPFSYNAPVVSLAKRIAEELKLPTLHREDGSTVWWRIPFWGKYREDGHFEWKLRPELADALAEIYPELETHKRDKIEFAVDASLASDISESTLDASAPKFEYQSKPKKKAAPVIVSGHETYPRDRRIALNALSHAGYECEIDGNHESFIRKNSNVKYTEPHHLIPMSFSAEFEHSLDVEENIVSLCSNCHNQIHYGKDARELIEKLYSQRKILLEKVGLSIALDKLLFMYGIN